MSTDRAPANGDRTREAVEPARLVIGADGRYLDADPLALDLYGVTLDVLRERRVGDFAPPEYRDQTRELWEDFVASGTGEARSEWLVTGGGGTPVRVTGTLRRREDGAVTVTVTAVESVPPRPPAIQVQATLGRWRELERQLARLPAEDPARAEVESRIEAVREEYHRRVGRRPGG